MAAAFKLGIQDTSSFGGGHEDLVFKYEKYLVKADSTLTTIIYSDIVNVKLGKPLNGLICQNINEKTKFTYNIHLPDNVIAQDVESLEDLKNSEEEEIIEELNKFIESNKQKNIFDN